MRKLVIVVAGVVVLAAANWTIATREGLVRDGRLLLLELAPIDPRSLMQGDYMALNYNVANHLAFDRMARPSDGNVVVREDAEGVAKYVRVDDGTASGPGELRLRFRWREGRPKFATNAFFFEEGRGRDYANAKYGEFRVSPDGEMILTGLRGPAREPLGRP